MAKYCIYCGTQLPDEAQFCHACGKSQSVVPTPEKKVEIIEEEESDEMDLLSQLGYIAPKPKKKTTIPFEPNTKKEVIDESSIREKRKQEELEKEKAAAKKLEEQQAKEKALREKIRQEELAKIAEEKAKKEAAELQRQEKEAALREKIKQEELAKIAEEKAKKETAELQQQAKEESQKISTEIQPEPTVRDSTPENLQTQEKAAPQTPTPPRTKPRRGFGQQRQVIIQNTGRSEEEIALREKHSDYIEQRETQKMPFEGMKIKKNENVMPTSNSEVQYDLPDDFSISDEKEDKEPEITEAEKEEVTRRTSRRRTTEEPEAISSNKKVKTSFFKKKEVSVSEDEEESFNTDINETQDNKTSRNKKSQPIFQEGMYADEIEDNRRRKDKTIKIDEDLEDKPEERRRSGEGRKNIETNKKQRRKSNRNDVINKNVYDIEQDLSQLDPEERDYDGYYENVLPIDSDSLQKTKINPMYILIVLGVIGMLAGSILLIMYFLGLL